jgi:hypothetical protein
MDSYNHVDMRQRTDKCVNQAEGRPNHIGARPAVGKSDVGLRATEMSPIRLS